MVFFTLSGQPNMEDRLKGFKDVLDSRPNIKIADVIDIKSDARAALIDPGAAGADWPEKG